MARLQTRVVFATGTVQRALAVMESPTLDFCLVCVAFAEAMTIYAAWEVR